MGEEQMWVTLGAERKTAQDRWYGVRLVIGCLPSRWWLIGEGKEVPESLVGFSLASD